MPQPIATRFPRRVEGIDVWIGGRKSAESKSFMEQNNIRFVITATGKHNDRFRYPFQPDDDFKVVQFPIGWENKKREEIAGRFDVQQIYIRLPASENHALK